MDFNIESPHQQPNKSKPRKLSANTAPADHIQRKIKRVFDSLEKGLAARLAVFSGDTRGVEAGTEKIHKALVIRRRGFDCT